MDLRHTGENEGVGVVQWKSWQSNNFRRRRGSQADRATLFCLAVANEFRSETDLLADVEIVRRERLTTLGRLIGDPDVRREYGFDFVDDGVVFYFEKAHLLNAFQKIFSDMSNLNDGVGVDKIKSKNQRKAYVKQIADVLPSRAERLSEPRLAGANDPSKKPDELSAPESPVTPQKRRSLPKNERVIFQGLSLSRVDLRISQCLQQAQLFEIDAAPAVAAVMTRVIIELAVTDAGQKLGLSMKESDPLRKKIGCALQALDPDIRDPKKRDKGLEMAWIRSQDENALIVQAMNAFVHNILAQPTSSEVRELSKTFRPLLEQLDERLQEKKKS